MTNSNIDNEFINEFLIQSRRKLESVVELVNAPLISESEYYRLQAKAQGMRLIIEDLESQIVFYQAKKSFK